MDVLQASSAWLESMRQTHRTVSVTYTASGGSPQTITATVGRTEFELVDANGIVTRVNSRDYLITASQLNAAPKAGDKILDGGHAYAVNEYGSEPAWRWSDAWHQTYRVHCKEVKA